MFYLLGLKIIQKKMFIDSFFSSKNSLKNNIGLQENLNFNHNQSTSVKIEENKNNNFIKPDFDFLRKIDKNKLKTEVKIQKKQEFIGDFTVFENLKNLPSNIELTKESNFFEKRRIRALEKLQLSSTKPNLYEILSINSNAKENEIKKAYKKLSLKFHPDKDPNYSQESFLNIGFAYKILGNKDLRKIYDEQGLEEAELALQLQEGDFREIAEEIFENF